MDLWYYRTERLRRSVPREKREPQAGPASCSSDRASKEPDAGGDAVIQAEPETRETDKGEGSLGLPGSKSVARAEGEARNRGGPESPGGLGPGTQEQREGVPGSASGVGSTPSI